ncbi:hypothetical protein AB1N83_004217 [Pleurotus pulmonarius]
MAAHAVRAGQLIPCLHSSSTCWTPPLEAPSRLLSTIRRPPPLRPKELSPTGQLFSFSSIGCKWVGRTFHAKTMLLREDSERLHTLKITPARTIAHRLYSLGYSAWIRSNFLRSDSGVLLEEPKLIVDVYIQSRS